MRSGAGGGVVYTASHYTRIPPPTHARLTAALAGPGLFARLRAVFMALVVLGFIYTAVMACAITTLATHLDTTQPTQPETTHDTGPR